MGPCPLCGSDPPCVCYRLGDEHEIRRIAAEDKYREKVVLSLLKGDTMIECPLCGQRDNIECIRNGCANRNSYFAEFPQKKFKSAPAWRIADGTHGGKETVRVNGVFMNRLSPVLVQG